MAAIEVSAPTNLMGSLLPTPSETLCSPIGGNFRNSVHLKGLLRTLLCLVHRHSKFGGSCVPTKTTTTYAERCLDRKATVEIPAQTETQPRSWDAWALATDTVYFPDAIGKHSSPSHKLMLSHLASVNC